MIIKSVKCPQRPGQAIKRATGAMELTDPPRTVMQWWCNCGFRAPAESEQGVGPDDWTRSVWVAAQRAEEYRLKCEELENKRPWWRIW